MKDEYKDVLIEALVTFGYRKQLDKVIEETIEFLLALKKFDDSKESLNNLIDEIADIKIVIASVDIIFINYNRLINERIDYKINRLKDILNKERNNNE
jgi:phosphoribosyl-ATP pyrophosphohydrolase